jgi:hypothetical protein
MYIYIYVYTYIYMNIYIYTYISIHTYVNAYKKEKPSIRRVLTTSRGVVTAAENPPAHDPQREACSADTSAP